MDTTVDIGDDETSTPLLSTGSDEDYSQELLQLREENADLRRRLRKANRKINEQIIEHDNLKERYYSAGENSISFKDELEATQLLLAKEQENIKELQGYIDHLRTEIGKSGQKSLIKLFDGIPGSEIKPIANGHAPVVPAEPVQKIKACHRLSAELDPDDLVLSCTLCSEIIRLDEITSHSRMCSAQSRSQAPQVPDTLQIRVTCSETDIENASFKIVTRTNLSNYDKSYFDVHRDESDCLWLRNNLQYNFTECVVPPLVQQTTLNGKTRELERFFSRLSEHKVLRTSSLLQLFLIGSKEDIELAKDEFIESQNAIGSPVEYKPSRKSNNDNGPLIKCQKYLSSLIKGLTGLINNLRNSLEHGSKKGRGRWFRAIADSEPEDTYLKNATQALSKVWDSLEKEQKEDEKLIIGDLQSVLQYICSCQELLVRVEKAVDKFLYWEEEIRVCEEMKKSYNEESDDQQSLTTRWAEATSNSHSAKVFLEMIYENLSDEINHFDYRKEFELRDIFIEYTTLKMEHYDKVKCKWNAAMLMTQTSLTQENRAIVFT